MIDAATKLYLGSTAVARVYVGSTLVWSASEPEVAGPAIDAQRAGVLSAKPRPKANPQVTRAGVLTVKPRSRANPRVTRAGVLVVRKASS